MTRLQGDCANISGAQRLLEVTMLQATLPEYLLVIEKVTRLEYLQVFIPVLTLLWNNHGFFYPNGFFFAEMEYWLLEMNGS